MQLIKKLEILADAAKYDASCASSGASAKNSTSGRGIGSTGGMGICHSYTPDGRCISLLKNSPHQFLPVRMPLLCEPQFQQRAQGAIHDR